MPRKNPENKPLRIVSESSEKFRGSRENLAYPLSLAMLAVAESNLVKGGKSSAMPHFIAIVKELESYFGIRFEQMSDEELDSPSD